MIDKTQALQIARYCREIALECDGDGDPVAVAAKLATLADGIEADSTVMCGVNVMDYVRRVNSGLVAAVPSEPLQLDTGDEETTG